MEKMIFQTQNVKKIVFFFILSDSYGIIWCFWMVLSCYIHFCQNKLNFLFAEDFCMFYDSRLTNRKMIFTRAN